MYLPVCAQERHYHDGTVGEPRPEEVWSIAGEGTHTHGRHLDPIPTRLKSADSGADAGKEGLRISFNGGMHENVEGFGNLKQKAYVELLCNRDWSGLETAKRAQNQTRLGRRDEKSGNGNDGDEGGDDGKDEGDDGGNDDGDGDNEDPQDPPLEDPDDGSALRFKSYTIVPEKDDEYGVLRLEWQTQYACEDAVEHPPPDDEANTPKRSSGLGFFGWFFVMCVR